MIEHARDIPDEDFLLAVESCRYRLAFADGEPMVWAHRWDVAAVLAGRGDIVSRDVPYDVEARAEVDRLIPEKIILAKFRRLRDRKMLTGCDCGCRGDFQPLNDGEDVLRGMRVDQLGLEATYAMTDEQIAAWVLAYPGLPTVKA